MRKLFLALVITAALLPSVALAADPVPSCSPFCTGDEPGVVVSGPPPAVLTCAPPSYADACPHEPFRGGDLDWRGGQTYKSEPTPRMYPVQLRRVK
jgi:hypothetical protein